MMTHFVCTNCGFWQKRFEAPISCPVCLDIRHTPPEDGWKFLSADEAAQSAGTTWSEDERGIVTFRSEPSFGIGPNGYLLRHPEGNVVFDNCPWYSDAALDYIEGQGGLSWISASHAHAYGALWRLQERFPEARVAITVADLPWTNAFDVTDPVDDLLEINGNLLLQKTGGHFDGHTILYWPGKRTLFAGDMLKLHFADNGELAALSSHKAFNRRIPMSRDELHRYSSALTLLSCNQVYTTFDHAHLTARQLQSLFCKLMKRPPSIEPVPLDML